MRSRSMCRLKLQNNYFHLICLEEAEIILHSEDDGGDGSDDSDDYDSEEGGYDPAVIYL